MFGTGKKNARGATSGRTGSGGLSFFGSDVTVSGDVASPGQVHVDGRVDGDVRCDTLIQGEGGTIAGHITCDTVHLAGLVDGAVQARVVTLEPTARVTGDVTYETLSISAGATIEGRLTRKEASGPNGGGPATAPDPGKTGIARSDSSKPDTAKPEKSGKLEKTDEPGLLAIGAAG